jgi:CsoR family transcriptional regulator, copper-sensing transcriptional repressor
MGEYLIEEVKVAKKQDKIILRIKKVKGQVAGLENMVKTDRSCFDIVQQIAAARSALANIAAILLAENACQLKNKKGNKELERTLKELIKSL